MSNILGSSKKSIILVFLLFLALCIGAITSAFFTDRANKTTTISAASFSDAGYEIKREAPSGYFTAGESLVMTWKESNLKSEDVTSQVTLKASWDSPDKAHKPWGNPDAADNVVITSGSGIIDYKVNEDGTISIQFPKKALAAGSIDSESEMRMTIPAALSGTGQLKFAFDEVKVSQSPHGFINTYDNGKLNNDPDNPMDFSVGVAWNISKDQSTKDVIAYLADGAGANEYGLEIVKNGSDSNTNKGLMMDWPDGASVPWASYALSEVEIADSVLNIGDYAFQNQKSIQSLALPDSVSDIGKSAYDGTGLSGTLTIPSTIKAISDQAFANLPKVTEISFSHGESDSLKLPTAGEGTGAFYLATLLETPVSGAHPAVESYDWVADNRATYHPIDSAELSYDNVAVGATVDPQLTILPEDAVVTHTVYEISVGDEFASIDPNTGKLTGKANGVVMVKVTLTDDSGASLEAACTVQVGSQPKGTRYVWSKNSIGYVFVEGPRQNSERHYITKIEPMSLRASRYATINAKGTIDLSGTSITYDEVPAGYYFNDGTGLTSVTLSHGYTRTYYPIKIDFDDGYQVDIYGYTSQVTVGQGAGEVVGTVSSASNTAYPGNGVSGSNWYVYKGADNIDADLVSYSKSSVIAGNPVTVKAAPSKQNVFGGTISYTYEYSTDNGSTWKSAGTTTDTSKEIEVPIGAQSFTARVKAKDNWGYTSSVFIYGAKIKVNQPTPISSAILSYEDVEVNGTVDPALTITAHESKIVSTEYRVINGESYAAVDAANGVVTGKANGVAIVQVTIKDNTGATITAAAPVKVGTPPTGTRYVWEKSTSEKEFVLSEQSTGFGKQFAALGTYSGSIRCYRGTGYTVSGNSIVLTGVERFNPERNDPPSYGSTDLTGYYHYYEYEGYGGNQRYPENPNEFYYGGTASYSFWNGGSQYDQYTYSASGYLATPTVIPGTLQGKVSSNLESAYPIDGESGGYWYTYMGADSIDADAVTYSKPSVSAGSNLTIKAAPSTKNVYRGEISYLYEYSTDGGATWSAAGTTTAESLDIKVPLDAKSIFARVKASDNWGYTSSEYVYGKVIPVTAPVPISSATLSYEDVAVGATVDPTLTIEPEDSVIVKKEYEVTTGQSFASVDSSTGKVTGKSNGVAVIQVTITDGTGATLSVSSTVKVGTPPTGTRHVWEKYSTSNVTTYTEIPVPDDMVPFFTDDAYCGHDISVSNGVASLTKVETIIPARTNTQRSTENNGQYMILGGKSSSTVYYNPCTFWLFGEGDEHGIGWYITSNKETEDFFDGQIMERTYTTEKQKGDLIGIISSDSSSAYPADGASGEYWYVYKGTDSIDANSVSYSASSMQEAIPLQ